MLGSIVARALACSAVAATVGRGLAARACLTAAAVVATIGLARGPALAHAFSLEAIVCAAVAWRSSRTAATRAADVERFLRACAFAAAACVTTTGLAFASIARESLSSVDSGGLDLAFVSLFVALVVVSRVALACAMPRIAVVAPRQLALAAAALLASLHATDARLVTIFALGTFALHGCAAAATRNADPRSNIEFDLDALATLTFAALGAFALARPWNAGGIAAVVCTSLAALPFALSRAKGIPLRRALAARALAKVRDVVTALAFVAFALVLLGVSSVASLGPQLSRPSARR